MRDPPTYRRQECTPIATPTTYLPTSDSAAEIYHQALTAAFLAYDSGDGVTADAITEFAFRFIAVREFSFQ